MLPPKFYSDKDRQRQYEVTSLRKELTRLTVRLNEKERSIDSLEHRCRIQNEKLAQTFLMNKAFRIRGGHPFQIWKNHVGHGIEHRLLERSSHRLYHSRVRHSPPHMFSIHSHNLNSIVFKSYYANFLPGGYDVTSLQKVAMKGIGTKSS